MPVRHQTQALRLPAGADLTGKEGYFVTLSGGSAVLATSSATAADIFGCVNCGDESGQPADLFLPGYSGLVDVAVESASADSVAIGTRLMVGASGAAAVADSGVAVAVAVSAVAEGRCLARLIEPVDIAGE